MKIDVNGNNVYAIVRRVLTVATVIGVLLEMIFFPSLGNLMGCLMTIASCVMFSYLVFKGEYITKHVFAFIAYLTLFLYRFLPLFVTMLEKKEISYGMVNPERTFALETIMMFIATLAFLATCKVKFCLGNRLSNAGIIRGIFSYLGFFDNCRIGVLWFLGFIGILARLQTYTMGPWGAFFEFGTLGKFLTAFVNLLYAPVLLFFPGLMFGNDERINFRQPIVWIYIVFICVLCLGSNSRNDIIAPFAIIALLMFIEICSGNVDLKYFFGIKRIIVLITGVIIVTTFLNIASDAILITRNVRSTVSFSELIQLSMENIVSISESGDVTITDMDELTSYDSGWTEVYVNNFMLNRFCNIRITDEVLYYADNLYESDRTNLQKNFVARLIYLVPQPVLDILHIDFDKSRYDNSRGDYLYYLSGVGSIYSLGGYRITSSLGDGLATFGRLYFPLQLIIWFLIFKLLDTMVLDIDGKVKYSVFGCLNIYNWLGLLRNANGMIGDFGFLLRNFWQYALIYLIAYLISKTLPFKSNAVNLRVEGKKMHKKIIIICAECELTNRKSLKN